MPPAHDFVTSQSVRPRDGLKWFCAISAATMDYADYAFRDMIKVAVASALLNTNLRPHLIYDGPPDEFTADIAMMGATILHRRSSIYDALHASFAQTNPNWLHVAAGAFLRFEIPLLEEHDTFALYTDCDVMFFRQPVFGGEMPFVFAATTEFSDTPKGDMNSGVMLINLPNMRKALPYLFDFSRKNLHLGLDQEMLRAFFGTEYTELDRTLNWRPYWGWNPAAQVVHFHGPKPVAAQGFLTEGRLPPNEPWTRLLRSNPAGYDAYTRQWFYYRDVVVPRLMQERGVAARDGSLEAGS